MKLNWMRISVLLVMALALFAGTAAAKISKETQACLDCHESMPGVVKQWEKSEHWQAGVGCYECHEAKKGDVDAMDHYGYTVSIIVSPRDCGRCHPDESAEQEASHHSKAGDILNTKDGVLGQTVGGEPAVVLGCRSCHGSVVKVIENGKLDPTTWPNGGIGRNNPDGSKGSCSACHQRHRFNIEQARRPEACGKCHLGPDHPQMEVFEESKHGNNYLTYEDELNMDHAKWVVGEDYDAAPTCATCHMSATPTQGITHDVGDRNSWNLRAPVSKRTKNWEKKLDAMKDVCSSCHNPNYVDAFYSQLDEFVALYNNKFAIPAKEIVGILKKEGVVDNQPFNDEIDWLYWELWHHEGRRARHGAAMNGPDYAWWHGIYDVAKNFYKEFLPAAKHLSEEAGKPEVYKMIIKKYIDGRPEHEWYTKGFDKKRMEELKKYYKDRYNQKVE